MMSLSDHQTRAGNRLKAFAEKVEHADQTPGPERKNREASGPEGTISMYFDNLEAGLLCQQVLETLLSEELAAQKTRMIDELATDHAGDHATYEEMYAHFQDLARRLRVEGSEVPSLRDTLDGKTIIGPYDDPLRYRLMIYTDQQKSQPIKDVKELVGELLRDEEVVQHLTERFGNRLAAIDRAEDKRRRAIDEGRQ